MPKRRQLDEESLTCFLILVHRRNDHIIHRYPMLPMSEGEVRAILGKGEDPRPSDVIRRYQYFLEQTAPLIGWPADDVRQELTHLQDLISRSRTITVSFERRELD